MKMNIITCVWAIIYKGMIYTTPNKSDLPTISQVLQMMPVFVVKMSDWHLRPYDVFLYDLTKLDNRRNTNH